MRCLLFGSLLLLFTVAYGQTDTVVIRTPNVRFWYLGARGSALIGYRQLLNTDGSATSDDVIALRDDIERPKVGYELDVMTGYQLNNRWSMEVGVGFSNRGYSTNKLDVLTFDYPEVGVTTGRFIYHNYYLDIPVRMHATFGQQRIRFIAGAGLTTGIFVTGTTVTVIKGSADDGRSTRESDFLSEYQRMNLFAELSGGIVWALHPQWSLRAELGAQYGLLKMTDTPVSARLYNGCLSVSLLKRL